MSKKISKDESKLQEIEKRLSSLEITGGNVIETLERNAEIINHQHETMKFIIEFAKSMRKIKDDSVN